MTKQKNTVETKQHDINPKTKGIEKECWCGKYHYICDRCDRDCTMGSEGGPAREFIDGERLCHFCTSDRLNREQGRPETTLYDVLAVRHEDDVVKWVEHDKTYTNAEAIMKMAIMRQGLDECRFVIIPSGPHASGHVYEAKTMTTHPPLTGKKKPTVKASQKVLAEVDGAFRELGYNTPNHWVGPKRKRNPETKRFEDVEGKLEVSEDDKPLLLAAYLAGSRGKAELADAAETFILGKVPGCGSIATGKTCRDVVGERCTKCEDISRLRFAIVEARR